MFHLSILASMKHACPPGVAFEDVCVVFIAKVVPSSLFWATFSSIAHRLCAEVSYQGLVSTEELWVTTLLP